ncbi:glycoside hydrolase family 26 protein [Streptomyces sp. NBC_01190]|uniref:glycoside hydrolase family 26 protein n=1 Tax=Streptomyces sp. NBC_01190 TaxID=2903767 RepID=UPI00386461C7|nr:glycosyl hydrolase [Streptomyces sp. NBC_01190]
MADPRQWLTRTGVGAVAVALLLSGLTTSANGDETSPSAAAPSPAPGSARPGDTTAGTATSAGAGQTPAAPATAAAPIAPAEAGTLPAALPPMGVFTDSGPDGISSIGKLENWLGGTQLRVGHTYLSGDRWDSIEGGGGLLQPWADWKRAVADRMFVLNVPMQQDNEGHLSDPRVRRLIQAGASGANDVHFTRLAERLVQLGVPDTVIVLGWEMNGTTYSHRCGPDPEGWKSYWDRIVTAMRAVPGQHFRFDFAPNRGQDDIGWTACYPGDKTVDIIGMDSYDQPAGESFYDEVTEPFGLQAQVDFAAEHGKPISYPEWGLYRGGDNPDYMSLMLGWVTSHKPVYQTITDYCPHGVWECGDNPKASSVYKTLLFGRKVSGAALPPAATPPAPAAPSAPPAPPSPTPAPTGGSAATAVPTHPVKPTPRPAKPPRPSAATPIETCLSMRLPEIMGQSYTTGQVCMKFRPSASTPPKKK